MHCVGIQIQVCQLRVLQLLQRLGHRIFDIPFRLMERSNSLFCFKKVLFESILRFDTECNIGMSNDNYVTKHVRNYAFDKRVYNMQLKEWSRNLNEDLLHYHSKYPKEGDTRLGRLEGDIDALKGSNRNIRQTNELITNKINNLTSMLENQSLMMKAYFGKETGIEKNFNLNTSNDKELIGLNEKKVIKKTYFEPFNGQCK